MILCVNCSAETKARMDTLLAKSSYSDYSELIAVAIENLSVLSEEVGSKGAIFIGETSVSPTAIPPLRQNAVASPRVITQAGREIAQVTVPKSTKKAATQETVSIPAAFQRNDPDGDCPAVAEIPVAEPKRVYTLDEWLFGQYNKLLPTKASCRALVKLAVEKGGALPWRSTAAQISEMAGQLGDYLAEYDYKHQNNRDDALVTAFPRSGPEAEKGRARYATHFVGNVNSQGALGGLLWEYRFAALAPGDEPFLVPTTAAVEFARMVNPILDNSQNGPTQKFSGEEIAFLLGHIRTYLPVELFAFSTLLGSIESGVNTPDQLDKMLDALTPKEQGYLLSPSFLVSQRSGAISRLADLGLIRRIREGVRVTYSVTEEGLLFNKSL